MSIELSGGVSGLSFPAKTTFPTIGKNGGLKTINIDIKGKIDLPTGEATLNIQVIEPNFKVKIQGKRLRFPTREFRNPQLVLAKFGAVEGQASKPNQKINLNEIIEVKFVVQNTGVGTAENVSVLVENEQKGVMMLGVKESQDVTRKHPNFVRIEAGKYEAITYQYFVNSEFKGNNLEFRLRATEGRNKYGFSEKKLVPINAALSEEGEIIVVNPTPEDEAEGEVIFEDLPLDFSSYMPPPARSSYNVIAVTDLENKGVSQHIVENLNSYIESLVSGTKRYKLANRKELQKELNELKCQSSELFDQTQCFVKVGKKIGASQLLAGDVGKMGQTYQISLRLITMESSLYNSDSELCKECSEDDLFEAARALVSRMI